MIPNMARIVYILYIVHINIHGCIDTAGGKYLYTSCMLHGETKIHNSYANSTTQTTAAGLVYKL